MVRAGTPLLNVLLFPISCVGGYTQQATVDKDARHDEFAVKFIIKYV